MNKRDRIILIVLVLLLAFFAPNYFITRPLVTELMTRRAHIAELRGKEADLFEIIAKNEANTLLLEDLTTELDDLMPDSNNIYKSYDSQYFLSNILQTHALPLSSLSLQEPKESGLLGLNEQSKTIEVENADPGKTLLYRIRMQETQTDFSVTGKATDILKAVDAINDYSRYLSVTSIRIPDLEQEGEAEASLNMVVYMALKTDI